VGHKFRGYHWNLINRYPYDLVFVTTEIDSSLGTRTVRFRLKGAFSGEAISRGRVVDGVVYSESSFQVSVAFLDHHTPCLGFAIKECAHLNVWKNRLAELGLPVGPWLRELKRAVIENMPDDHPI
jgi:ribonuclease Z